VVLQRFFEIVSQESPDLETMSKALTALGKGSAHLSRLIHAEKSLSGEPEDGAAALRRAPGVRYPALHSGLDGSRHPGSAR
jgi:hypothetical protein